MNGSCEHGSHFTGSVKGREFGDGGGTISFCRRVLHGVC